MAFYASRNFAPRHFAPRYWASGGVVDVAPYLGDFAFDIRMQTAPNLWESLGDVGGGQYDFRSQRPIVIEYGITGSSVHDRVASAGSCRFSLDNSATIGKYSPLHPSKRVGFDFNVPIHVWMTSSAVSDTAFYKFYGRIADITVVPGKHGERVVHCTALDLMDDWARLPAPPLPIALDQNGAQLVTQLLDALPSDLQPPSRMIDPGLETYAIANDRAPEDTTTIRQVLHDYTLSGMAKASFIGSTIPFGGTFAWRNRQYTAKNPTVLQTFDEDMQALTFPASRDDLISKVQITVHPTRVDDTLQVLYDLQRVSAVIRPNETYNFLFGAYRNPNNNDELIGGINLQPLVPHVDYVMNSHEAGDGTDLTDQFTVVPSFTGSGVHFSITNNSASVGYVTLLKVRGFGVYRTRAMIEVEVPAVQYGHQVLKLDLPYQNDVNVATDLGHYLTTIVGQPQARVSSFTFHANRAAVLMDAALRMEPGDRIAVTEEVTGLSGHQFTINGVRLEIHQTGRPRPTFGLPGDLFCTWFFEPVDSQVYWSAGVPGSSEAGVTTIAGF